MTVAMATAATTDAAETVRIPTCAARQVITMLGMTAQTTGGRAITRDLRAAAAMATTTQGAYLGYILHRRGARKCVRDHDRNRDRDRGRDRVQHPNKDHIRQGMKVWEAMAKT